MTHLPRNFDLIMFDLDGTLIETAGEILDAVNDTLRHFHLPDVTQKQVTDWIGHGTGALLKQALAHSTGTEPLALLPQAMAPVEAEFARCYLQRCGTRSRLYPRVRETLQALHARGVKLAVVTNKESRFTTAVLQAHQLMPLLDKVISGDSFPQKKPDPVGISSCLSELGIARARALFVGDSSIDVATARNAGVAVWALPYGYNMGRPIADSAPDRLIPDISVLLSA